MKPVLIGTSNARKAQEIKSVFADLPVAWKLLGEVAPGFDVDEDGETFEQNAAKKAVEAARHTGIAALAGDGGLEIPALGNWPGVHSRRINPDGSRATDEEIVAITSERIRSLDPSERTFRFVSVMAFALPDGTVTLGRGELVGDLRLELHPDPSAGFPFRRFWWLPQFGKYFLDLTPDEEATINHNREALNQVRPAVEAYLQS